MNNAQLIQDVLAEEPVLDVKAVYRKRAEELGEIIEALSEISQSSYWKVLRQYEFDGDLASLVSRLEKEKDTTEIFRLQGEIRRQHKYDLTLMLEQRRQELEVIRKKINA